MLRGQKISFVIPRTSLYRGLFYRGSTVLQMPVDDSKGKKKHDLNFVHYSQGEKSIDLGLLTSPQKVKVFCRHVE